MKYWVFGGFGLILTIAGFIVLWHYAGWVIAFAVFLIVAGNNTERTYLFDSKLQSVKQRMAHHD